MKWVKFYVKTKDKGVSAIVCQSTDIVAVERTFSDGLIIFRNGNAYQVTPGEAIILANSLLDDPEMNAGTRTRGSA